MRWFLNIRQWRPHNLSQITRGLYLLSAIGFSVALWSGWHLSTLAARNAMMHDPAQLLRNKLLASDERWSYAVGVASQATPEQALKLFYVPETSSSPRLRAMAKFAIGNLYFDWAMSHHHIEQGGAHQQQVAMIALAKEAYKDALRIDPQFSDARFNLELLDRRSPDKRTQGWQAETDGVTLKPFKRNGTAMMRDNERRGLP